MTAVITKYKKTFDRWVELNPHYPNPVQISDEIDIREHRFWYVIPCGATAAVFNYKRVKKMCEDRIILKVAIVSHYLIEARNWNKYHKKSVVKAVCVSNVSEAKDYLYTEVLMGQSAKYLNRADKVFMACQARCVPYLTTNRIELKR